MAIEPKRLTLSEWIEVEMLWERGLANTKQLSERFGISESTVRAHMKSAGIAFGSKADMADDQIDDEVKRKISEEAALTVKRISDIKNDTYSRVDALARLAMMEVAKARQDQVPLSSVQKNLKAIEIAINIVERARSSAYHVLGLNDENALPADMPELIFKIVDDSTIRLEVEANAKALAIEEEIEVLAEDEVVDEELT